MKSIIFVVIMFFPFLAFAETFQFISNGEFKITTRDNMNEDMIYDVMPRQYRGFLQPGDIGNMYQINDTGEMFFVLIHKSSMSEYNRGCEYGNKNVKIITSYIGTYHGMRMFEFVRWSN